VDRKIHILHVIEALREFGGTPVKLLYQVSNASPNFKFTICCVIDEGELAQKFREKGIEVVALNHKKNYDLRQINDIVNIIKSRKIDIVHTHFARSNTYGRIAALLSKRPAIVSEHGLVRNTSLPVLFFDNFLNFFTSHLVVNSYATLRNVQKKVFCNRGNMSVIYNGVPDLFRDNLTIPKEKLKRAYGFNAEDFIILNIGGHLFWRKHMNLIKAVAKTRALVPQLKVVQIGPGYDRKAMEAAIKEFDLGDIFFFWGKTQREKIHNFIYAADVYVNCAVLEGFGIATVEAMLCELPVVCANAGSLPELINHEKEGLLFEPTNSEELAQNISTLYKSQALRRKLGKAARVRALEKFGIERFVKEFEEKYQSMISHSVNR